MRSKKFFLFVLVVFAFVAFAAVLDISGATPRRILSMNRALMNSVIFRQILTTMIIMMMTSERCPALEVQTLL